MAVTILEGLENAKYNYSQVSILPQVYFIALSQLSNCIILLEKGYPAHTLVEPLLEKYGKAENVPDFQPEEQKT